MERPEVSPSVVEPLFANRFEIDRPVGAGGIGLVYRARDRYTGAWVALKVLHNTLGSGPFALRFLREAQILSELGHPHIVSYVAHGEAPDGRRYLAMEWLEGQDLSERLRQGPLSFKQALRLLEHVADGLAAAHQRGIIHRDLKPANLFLQHNDVDQVKILDFGIARRTVVDETFTQTGTAIGTPEYMAPEQARGFRDLSEAADIFSLGCVFHQCLTGKSPFGADSLAATLVRILFDEAPLIACPPPDFPPAVLGLLQKMLSKEPTDRFQDAVALLSAMQGLGEVGSAKTTGEIRAAITLSGYTLASREGDQEIFSIVIVQPPSGNTEHTLPNAEFAEPTATISANDRTVPQELLASSLEAMGVRVEIILGGAVVVTVPAMDSAVDQVAQAARAALMIKRLQPQARVALATGRGIVKGQMAIGEVVSRALRMLADSGTGDSDAEWRRHSGVWTDRLSAQLLPPSFQFAGTGEHPMLTREEESADDSRPLLGKPTPCVGRDAELATLDGHLSTCLNDCEFRGILVTGPPGSGKSRLRHEFLRRIAQSHEEVRILIGRGELLSAGTPFHILTNALRRFWELGAELSQAELAERLESIAADSNQTEEDAEPAYRILPEFLGELAGRSLQEENYPALRTARQDPSLMEFQLRRTFIAWLEQECRKGPLLFLFDDLHWGDALTISLFDQAMQELPSSSCFVLALARPEVHTTFTKLWQGRPIHEVVLKGLSRKACERLIQHTLGNKIPAKLVTKIIEQSVGNALFLEELIRVASEGNQDSLPETVLAMLQARIGRLPVEARRTLRAASVFGQTFWSVGLAAAMDTAAGDRLLLEALQILLTGEFIEKQPDSAFPGQIQYGFRHGLMREAAYALLGESDRVALHRQAGLFLAEQPGAEPKMVAEHFVKGQEPHRAVPWFLLAARHAFDSNDLSGAMSYVEQSEGCGAEGEELGKLRALKTEIAHWAGDYQRCRKFAEEELAQLTPGIARWYHAMTRALVSSGRMGDSRRMEILRTEMLEMPPIGDAVNEKLIGLCRASFTMLNFGFVDQVKAMFHSMIEIINQHQVTNPAVLAQYHEVIAQVAANSPLEYLQNCEKALLNHEQAGDVRNVIFARTMVGSAQASVGCSQDAERLIRTNLAASQKMKFRPGIELARLGLAIILVREHRNLAEARQLLQDADSWYKQIGYLYIRKMISIASAEADYAEKRYERTISWVDEIRAIEKQMKTGDFAIGVAFALEARALLGLGRLPEALQAARRANEQKNATWGLGLLYWSHLPSLALAEVLFALGEHEEARQVLGTLWTWLLQRAESIPNPEWRSQYLRTPDYAHIVELAKQLGLG